MRGERRGGRAVLGVLAVALLATGCMRAQVAAAVRSDDTVTGELVVATVVTTADEPGSVVRPPSDMGSRVRAQPYRQDDYAGTRLLFDRLTFEEFGRLNQVAGGESGRLRVQLRRAGELVLFTGRVDLVDVPAPERADVGVRLTFPGRITATNGRQVGNEVSWDPPVGQVTDLTATVRYADPTATRWTTWVALVGGLAGVGALMVLALAFVAHRRSERSYAVEQGFRP
jgi:hypothetical protein